MTDQWALITLFAASATPATAGRAAPVPACGVRLLGYPVGNAMATDVPIGTYEVKGYHDDFHELS